MPARQVAFLKKKKKKQSAATTRARVTFKSTQLFVPCHCAGIQAAARCVNAQRGTFNTANVSVNHNFMHKE